MALRGLPALVPPVASGGGRASRALWAASVLAAIVALTAVLAWVGGPASHVSVLYLVPVAAAALGLGTRWGFAALAASTACYASLFLLSGPPTHGHGHDAPNDLAGHITGMWLATLVVAGVVATLMGRMAAALRDREEDMRALEARAARDARLVALSTLAAGAAHELGSPLATIAVAARELEHGARKGGTSDEVAEDARLIRAEVERCRAILAEMSAGAGQAQGELPERMTAREIVERACASLPAPLLQHTDVSVARDLPALRVPAASTTRALANLLRNAFDASEPGARVSLRATAGAAGIAFEVEDHGAGMDAETLARAREPFFSTKEPGRGQGLGLFLADAVATQLGGSLRLESAPGRGTRARLELPAEAA